MKVILGYSSEWYPPLDQAVRHIALRSSEVNSRLFLSPCLLLETKSSRNELFTFVYGGDVGIYMSAGLTWMFRIWKARSARGHDRIRDCHRATLWPYTDYGARFLFSHTCTHTPYIYMDFMMLGRHKRVVCNMCWVIVFIMSSVKVCTCFVICSNC